uniref:Secreted protein n=1 Tax=Plectus sambesii TaxID=2011161 RepID=A0A914XH97_9BILA
MFVHVRSPTTVAVVPLLGGVGRGGHCVSHGRTKPAIVTALSRLSASPPLPHSHHALAAFVVAIERSLYCVCTLYALFSFVVRDHPLLMQEEEHVDARRARLALIRRHKRSAH